MIKNNGMIYNKPRTGMKLFLRIFFLFALCSSAFAADSAPGRFKDNGNGTVTDSSTGLMWTLDANPAGREMLWYDAQSFVKKMNSGAGTHGYKDWRMPSIKELQGLVGVASATPLSLSAVKNVILDNSAKLLNSPAALPQGHPFKNVVPDWYWSFTDSDCRFKAWVVNFATGQKWNNGEKKWDLFYVWPVRGKPVKGAR